VTGGLDWHYGDELNDAVHKYYAKHARQSPQHERARLLHAGILEDIRAHLADLPRFPHGLEPIADTGGAAGDANDKLEFRVHFVMVINVIVTVCSTTYFHFSVN